MALLREGNLSNVKPRLVAFVRALAAHFHARGVDIAVTEGLRTLQRSAELYAQGRTRLVDDKGKPLAVVTNARPGESQHNPDGDGLSWAVDVCPVIGGVWQWNNAQLFADMGEFAESYADIEWGGNYRTIKDGPHFALKGRGSLVAQPGSATTTRGALWVPYYLRDV